MFELLKDVFAIIGVLAVLAGVGTAIFVLIIGATEHP